MHSLIHVEHSRAVAAERSRLAAPRQAPPVRPEPPPVRQRAARAAVRLALRIDHDAARRAVA